MKYIILLYDILQVEENKESIKKTEMECKNIEDQVKKKKSNQFSITNILQYINELLQTNIVFHDSQLPREYDDAKVTVQILEKVISNKNPRGHIEKLVCFQLMCSKFESKQNLLLFLNISFLG